MKLRKGWLVASLACAPSLACVPYSLPLTQPAPVPSAAGMRADPHQAALVFLWPMTSCDPPGYYTLVTAEGRFLGTMSRGKQLHVEVPPGETTVIGWNEVREEAGGAGRPGVVPVLRAELSEGRTYYVRMALGDWDVEGPHKPRMTPCFSRRPCGVGCVSTGPEGPSAAMETLTPAHRAWSRVPEWTASLEVVTPDEAAGQAWADEHTDALRAHVAIGEGRYDALRPDGKKLATVAVEDGVAGR